MRVLVAGAVGLLATAPSLAAAQGVPAVRLGHASIHERAGEPLTVFVDGVEAGAVGPGTWEGDLEEGAHEAFGTSPTRTTVVERFTVTAGATVVVELTALPRATPAKKTAGTALSGAADRAASSTSTSSAGGTRAVRSAPPPGHAAVGPYGGFEAQLLLEPSGTHSDICTASASTITGCSTSAPIGGGFLAYAGYQVAPVGLDVMMGFQADGAGMSGKISGMPVSLTVPRVGGVFALRARLAWDSPSFGASLALGFGAAVRDVIFIALSATSKTYTAPGVVLDAALRARFAPSTALSFGVFMWGENAGNDVALKVDPLPSQVHVVQSTQFFALPYVGVEFGP